MNIRHRAPEVPVPSLGTRVLAERNQAAAAVGAWVESGEELREHPATLACLTEELQQQRRLRSEHHLRLFQENVRLRLAEQERRRRRARPGVVQQVMPSASGGDGGGPWETGAQERPQSSAWVRQRLAGPRLQEPVVRPHEAAGHMCSDDEDTLTAHKGERREESPDQDHPVREGWACRVLWPIDQSEELRKQRQAQILNQRRLFLRKDRQNVKENQEHKRHAQKTASLKQEKERVRLEEERRLGESRLLSVALETLEQREQQIQQALKQASTAGEQERRDRHAPKTNRQMSVLRAQLKELFSGAGSEPPPLCCCGSFWESHPDTCANNCVFHNNPKAYIQALRTALHSWDLL